MIVKRQTAIELTETDNFELYDIIPFDMSNGEHHEMIAVKQYDNAMLFAFTECLDETHCMNEEDTTEGGYLASDLRRWLKEDIETLIPDEIKEHMVPNEDGDLLFIPTKEMIFGGDIEYFNNEKNRIATHKDKTCPYWMQNVVPPRGFACANYGGFAYYSGAANTIIGCRPFALLNLNPAVQGHGASAKDIIQIVHDIINEMKDKNAEINGGLSKIMIDSELDDFKARFLAYEAVKDNIDGYVGTYKGETPSNLHRGTTNSHCRHLLSK